MKIVGVIKTPEYLAIAIGSSISMLALYAYSQVLGNVNNLDLWVAVMPWYNKVLISIFVALFGMVTAYQIYMWRQPRSCSISMKGNAMGASSAGTFGVFLVAQCPACASIAALFLPVSVGLFLGNFGWLITIVGIAMIVFTINYLGGFKR